VKLKGNSKKKIKKRQLGKASNSKRTFNRMQLNPREKEKINSKSFKALKKPLIDTWRTPPLFSKH
jgi:hypothetical protein